MNVGASRVSMHNSTTPRPTGTWRVVTQGDKLFDKLDSWADQVWVSHSHCEACADPTWVRCGGIDPISRSSGARGFDTGEQQAVL
jgi:hypothetical protein